MFKGMYNKILRLVEAMEEYSTYCYFDKSKRKFELGDMIDEYREALDLSEVEMRGIEDYYHQVFRRSAISYKNPDCEDRKAIAQHYKVNLINTIVDYKMDNLREYKDKGNIRGIVEIIEWSLDCKVNNVIGLGNKNYQINVSNGTTIKAETWHTRTKHQAPRKGLESPKVTNGLVFTIDNPEADKIEERRWDDDGIVTFRYIPRYS